MFSQLPSTFVGWSAFIVLVVAGALALYGIIDKARRDRRKEEDAADDRLINILKGTVDELEAKVNKQDGQIKELTSEISALKITNQTLVDVLSGRDDATLAFYKAAGESIDLHKDTHALVKSSHEQLGKLAGLIEQHLKSIESVMRPT